MPMGPRNAGFSQSGPSASTVPSCRTNGISVGRSMAPSATTMNAGRIGPWDCSFGVAVPTPLRSGRLPDARASEVSSAITTGRLRDLAHSLAHARRSPAFDQHGRSQVGWLTDRTGMAAVAADQFWYLTRQIDGASHPRAFAPGWRRRFRKRFWQHRRSLWYFLSHLPTFLAAKNTFEPEPSQGRTPPEEPAS